MADPASTGPLAPPGPTTPPGLFLAVAGPCRAVPVQAQAGAYPGPGRPVTARSGPSQGLPRPGQAHRGPGHTLERPRRTRPRPGPPFGLSRSLSLPLAIAQLPCRAAVHWQRAWHGGGIALVCIPPSVFSDGRGDGPYAPNHWRRYAYIEEACDSSESADWRSCGVRGRAEACERDDGAFGCHCV